MRVSLNVNNFLPPLLSLVLSSEEGNISKNYFAVLNETVAPIGVSKIGGE